MTYEEKSAIVIEQLRADRNRLLSVLDKIREEIIELPTISFNANDVYKADILQIIDKYKAESEDKGYEM